MNNGLITKIWGPGAWKYLHSVTFGYPIEPTDEQKKFYKLFFELVGDTLPCKHCRDSYKIFISTGITELNDDVLRNRDSLTKWFYLVHEKVNEKLGVDYGVSYEDIRKIYESYRAKCSIKNEKGCINPLYDKITSYKNAYMNNCPVVPINIAERFKEYARIRGIRDIGFIDKCRNKIFSRKKCDSKCKIWCERNMTCFNIITQMRVNAIPSLETDGKWKGLPTKCELILIMRLSSTLSIPELNDISKKLPRNKKIREFYIIKNNYLR